MAYADYAYYTGSFLGNAIAQADFPRLSLRASEVIDYFTRDKAKQATDTDVVDALAKCCCALAEQEYADELARRVSTIAAEQAVSGGGGEVKSETVGGYSVSYTTAADYAGKASGSSAAQLAPEYLAILRRYLANTGLLYRGAC